MSVNVHYAESGREDLVERDSGNSCGRLLFYRLSIWLN